MRSPTRRTMRSKHRLPLTSHTNTPSLRHTPMGLCTPQVTSSPTLIVLNPMRKLVLPMANFKRLAGVLLATSVVATSAAAQEPQKPTLTTEIGLSTVWNTGMNISPFGLKYQSEYFGLRPALHAQVLLQYKPGIIRKTKRAAHRKRSVHPHTPLRRNEALHFRGIYQGRSATIRTPFLHQSNRVGSSSLT